MTPPFIAVHNLLKQLPGLGHRSAERIALYLLVEKPEKLNPLIQSLQKASESLIQCKNCGNLSESDLCSICTDTNRNQHILTIVERIPDLFAIERSGAYKGQYHVLHGKLSPLHGVHPEHLNLLTLKERLDQSIITEVILALSNDIEGEATCHYIQDTLLKHFPDLSVTRIGFGLPTGSSLMYADPITLKSAIDARRKI